MRTLTSSSASLARGSRRLQGACLVTLALAEGCEGDGTPADVGTGEADASRAPTIGLVPSYLEAPPGAYADMVVVASGELGASSWTLSLDGLPAGYSASFSPEVLDAAHPRALLLLDVSPSAPTRGASFTVRAHAGEALVEAPATLVVADRPEPGFSLAARLLGEPGADGSVDGTVRVVSHGGFAGDVHLVTVGAAVAELSPRVVVVAPGAPATATLRAYRELEGTGVEVVGVHRRRVERAVMASLLAELEMGGAWPACYVGATARRLWAPPGADVRSGGRALTRSPIGALALALEARAPTGIDASLTPSPPDGYWMDLSIGAGGSSGDVLVVASAPGAVGARTSVHVVVPRASAGLIAAGGALVAAPVAAPEDLAAVSRAEGVVIPRVEPGGTFIDADPHGGEVLAHLVPGVGLAITEAGRTWPTIAGAQGEPAVSHDVAGRLWVATRYEPGLVGVWDRSPGGLLRAHTTGLPTTVIEAGPWLAAGAGAPVLAFVHEGALHVARLAGDAWVELDAPSDAPPPDTRRASVALRQDGAGRPLLAIVDDRAGILALRFEGEAWARLGEVPLDPGQLSLGLALAIDASGRPLLAWSEAAHVAPPAGSNTGLAGSRVRFARFDGLAWSSPIELALDPAAVPGAPVLARGATASLVAWGEPETIVARIPD